MNTKSELSNDLIALLDQERAAIRTADFAKLEHISAQKEGISEKLKKTDSSIEKSALDTLRKMTAENAALYKASLTGMKLALDRISEVRQSFGQLKTYNTHGQLSTESTSQSAVSKRA